MEHTSMDELVQAPGAELEALKNAIRQEMHCALPAVVESYDKATQTVTVKPALRERLFGGAYVELPLLSDVPVFFPGGAASGITFPVQKGDECLVVFSDSCIDAWYQYGGTQNPVSLRRHDLSDGFAFIGFRSRKNALPSVSDTPSFFGAKAGQDGKDGKDGASAYELAVAAGFEGNETEWLKSLHGKDGKDGQDGAQGPQGEQGAVGPQGEQGPAGIADVNGIAPDENGHVELSANDVGALPAGGTAKDAEKLGGKAPAYYLQPRNLLDNSDFTRVVNQRGQAAYTANADVLYTIDRWQLTDASVDVHSNLQLDENETGVYYVALSGKYGQLRQFLDVPRLYYGKMLTFAMYLKDEPPEKMMLLINTNTQQSEVEMHVGLNVVSHVVQQDAPTIFIAVQNNNLTTAGAIHPLWAALYEGEYTAANLPAYVPKGYSEELTACQRFYENSWFVSGKAAKNEYTGQFFSNSGLDAKIEFKVPKRISASISFYPCESYAGWMLYQNAYIPFGSVSSVGRNGVQGFVLRGVKSISDSSTWVAGQTVGIYGHWEASADL